jgi:arginyl-tRNA synthetase
MHNFLYLTSTSVFRKQIVFAHAASHIHQMTIQETISFGIQQAFKACFSHDLPLEEISLAPTRKEFAGTYTFVFFSYLKISKLSPEATGNTIGAYLKENLAEVEDFNVVKGFLNLVLHQSVWIDSLESPIIFDDWRMANYNGDYYVFAAKNESGAG